MTTKRRHQLDVEAVLTSRSDAKRGRALERLEIAVAVRECREQLLGGGR